MPENKQATSFDTKKIVPMTVRERHARINDDTNTYTMPSGGLEIVFGESKQAALEVSMKGDGVIEIRSSSPFTDGDKVYDDRFSIRPISSNVFHLVFDELKQDER